MAHLITVELLDAVQTLSKKGSYPQAADELGLAPDLLRAQIAELEERLEFHVFETHDNQLGLSPEGQTFVNACRAFLEKGAESKQTGASE